MVNTEWTELSAPFNVAALVTSLGTQKKKRRKDNEKSKRDLLQST